MLFFGAVFKKFDPVQIIKPYDARKPYPKPWLQHIRGSDGERSPKTSALKKNTESQTWGGNVVKKTGTQLFVDSVFSRAGQKQSPKKVGTPLSVISSYMLDPGFWIWLPDILWHYNLHRFKLFKDFALKKSPVDNRPSTD